MRKTSDSKQEQIIEAAEPEDEIDLEIYPGLKDGIGREIVVWTDELIYIRRYREKGWTDQAVIGGYLRPIAHGLVNGQYLTEFLFDAKTGESKTCAISDMVKFLTERGRIFDIRRAKDVLSFLTHHMACPYVNLKTCIGVYPRETGDGYYVYRNGKREWEWGNRITRLALNTVAHPITDEQEQVAEDTKIARNFRKMIGPFKREMLGNYYAIQFFFNPHEFWPVAGLSVMAPYAELLRAEEWIVPYVSLWSWASDIGKTKLASAFTEHLYGMKIVPGDTLDSNFRLGSLLDSACLPVTIDEVGYIAPRVGSIIKTAVEGSTSIKRGTSDQGMRRWGSRASLITTSNRQWIDDSNVLKRGVCPHMAEDPETIASREEHRPEFDELMGELQPCGFIMQEEILTWIHPFSSPDTLMGWLQQCANTFSSMPGAHWNSASRPKVWAVLYAGTVAFQIICGHYDYGEYICTPERFYNEVIHPCEISTFESKRLPIQVAQNWHIQWMNEHTRKRRAIDGRGNYVDEDYVQGEGKLYHVGPLDTTEFHDFKKKYKEGHPGIEAKYVPSGECWWWTDPHLQTYNSKNPDHRIPSVKQLTIQGADFAGIPRELVLGKDGQALVKWTGTKSERLGFVPMSLMPTGLALLKQTEREEESKVAADEGDEEE